ncbi:YeeE/YedE family protein [Ferrimonas gelatinilytica]|uniref:YeeE/YedE thiosulfate transporter family protein n=1 Tax=Ferrimonas gelatinilytica TaxID=1255257 RepID=A0ABP9RVR7_9GAMM
MNALFGGMLIGFAALILMLVNGRIAGISGILTGALKPRPGDGWRFAFLLGLIGSGFTLTTLGWVTRPELTTSTPLMLIAGFLVGLGAYLGNGCTSGHGICGLGRLSTRSLAATAVFMATAVLTAILFHG